METPVKEPVISVDKTKKGNKDGINVLIHRSKPSLIPVTAVFPSNIIISIPAEPTRSGIRFSFRNGITSKESMQPGSKTVQAQHILFWGWYENGTKR